MAEIYDTVNSNRSLAYTRVAFVSSSAQCLQVFTFFTTMRGCLPSTESRLQVDLHKRMHRSLTQNVVSRAFFRQQGIGALQANFKSLRSLLSRQHMYSVPRSTCTLALDQKVSNAEHNKYSSC